MSKKRLKLIRFNFYMLTSEQEAYLRKHLGNIKIIDGLTNFCGKDVRTGLEFFDLFTEQYDIAEILPDLQNDLTLAIMNESEFVKRGGIVIRRIRVDDRFKGYEVLKTFKQEVVPLETHTIVAEKP